MSGAAGGQNPFQLAAGDDVKTGAQARQDIQYAQVGVGLDREADQVRSTRQGIGIRQVLGFDVRTGVDIGGGAKALGYGGQGNTFREQLSVTVVKSVHDVPLVGAVAVAVFVRFGLRRFRLFICRLAVIGQVQRAFLTAGR